MGNNKQNNKTRKQKYRWETHILELSTAQASNATTRLIQTDEIVNMRPLRYRAPTWVLNFHTLKEEAMRLGSAEMGGQSWNPECGSFWNIVIGDDDAIHQGYKNKRYRCRGRPNYFGGERCDGCH